MKKKPLNHIIYGFLTYHDRLVFYFYHTITKGFIKEQLFFKGYSKRGERKF